MTFLPNAFPGNPSIFQHITTTVVTSPIAPAEKFKAKKAGTKGFRCFLIVDESGSMGPLTKDTIGGVNAYIEAQKKDNDGTRITIVKFNGSKVSVPVSDMPVSEMGKFTDYSPAGGTNLLDAIGDTMQEINKMLSKTKKAERPSVFIQIITDGEENASRRYKRDAIKEMIGSATGADWVVTYVGANVDAFTEASSLGISASAATSYNSQNTAQTYDAIASSTSRLKGFRSMGTSVSELNTMDAYYDASEKLSMTGEKK